MFLENIQYRTLKGKRVEDMTLGEELIFINFDVERFGDLYSHFCLKKMKYKEIRKEDGYESYRCGCAREYVLPDWKFICDFNTFEYLEEIK